MSQFFTFPPSASAGSNASVGTNGAVAPTSSTEIAYVNSLGNLTPVSPSNPLPVNVTIPTDINSNIAEVNGNTVATGTGVSNSGTQRVAVSSDSSITANLGTLNGAATLAEQQQIDTDLLAFKAANHTDLAAINTTLGTPMQNSGGSVTANIGTTNGLALDSHLTNVQSAPGTAQTTAITVQGNASGIPMPITGTVTVTPSGEQNVNLNQVGGSAISIGQQLSAASLPVVLPAAQITALTPPTTVNAKLEDSSGNGIASLQDGNGGNAIEVAIAATGFQYASGNSTTTQLGAGATFTGTIDSVVNQQSYSILITSDQNGTLVLNQFIDSGGVHLVQQLTYAITAGQGFAKSGVMNGNYSQLKFTNNGGSATTTLDINTYYGTIPSSTQLNNSPMSLNEINGTAFNIGQQLSAASLPVVLPAAQITTLTPPTTVTVTQSTAANLLAQVSQPTAANLNATVVGTGTFATQAAQSGTWTVQPGNTANTTAWLTTDAADGPATPGTSSTKSVLQGVQYNTTLPTFTNGQQGALQSDSNGRILTNVATSALPTGAATSALQTTISGQLPASLGAKTTANSLAVNIASDQTVPVSISTQTLPSAPLSGQKTSTGTAVQIATTGSLVQGVVLTALPTNAGTIYVGPSGVTTSTGSPLLPGQSTGLAVSSLANIYFIPATSGDGIAYLGS